MKWAYLEAASLKVIAPIVKHLKLVNVKHINKMLKPVDKGCLSQLSGPKTIPDMSNLKRENTFGSKFGKFQCLVDEPCCC